MATLACTPIERTIGPSWLTERRWPPALLLAGLCAFLFFYGLDAGELYRTESLRAIVAAEFLRSGDWIVPRLYGEPLLTKPPIAYAAIALASGPFGGVVEWTARLPSAVAATLVVFLVYQQVENHLLNPLIMSRTRWFHFLAPIRLRAASPSCSLYVSSWRNG